MFTVRIANHNMSKSIHQTLEEKRLELLNLNEIKRFTYLLQSRLQQLESSLELMADGTDAAALVLSNWQNVVKSVLLASLGLAKHADGEEVKLPECLVRIKLDKDEPNQES